MPSFSALTSHSNWIFSPATKLSRAGQPWLCTLRHRKRAHEEVEMHSLCQPAKPLEWAQQGIYLESASRRQTQVQRIGLISATE